MARSKATPGRNTGPQSSQPREVPRMAARKSAPVQLVSFITVWNRAAVAAVRDSDIEALQRFQQDSAAGRPGPFSQIETSIVVDRSCTWVSLIGLAIVLEAEAAALWLVQDAKAEAAVEAAEAAVEAAEAAATSDVENNPGAALGAEDSFDSESSFGSVYSDNEPSSDEGWLYSRAHVLLPHPEEVPDGTGWPHYPLSAAEGLRFHNKVWLGTLDGERTTALELAVHQGMWRVVEELLCAGVPVSQNPYLLPQAEQHAVRYSRNHRHVWSLLEGHLGLAKRNRSHAFVNAIRGVALLERRVSGFTGDISRVIARWLRCPCGFCLRKRGQCPVCLEEGAAY